MKKWYFSMLLFLLIITVISKANAGEITIQISSSTDDCYIDEETSSIYLTATSLIVGGDTDSDGLAKEIGLRFQNVAIPNNAIINAAHLKMCSATDVGWGIHLLITGEDTGNASAFSTYSDFQNRNRTSASVVWDITTAWTAGVWYNSTDISSIVSEIVSRSDWQSGNAMVFFIELNTSTGATREIYSFDGNTTLAAKLYVSFTPLNNPPIIDGQTVGNDISLATIQLTAYIEDPDGDLMNWTIETSPNIGSASGVNSSNGTITCPISGLQPDTTYTWYVNVTDGYDWTNETYTFTTRGLSPPSNIIVEKINSTWVNISWTKGESADTTVIVKKVGSLPSSPSDGTVVYNDTGTYVATDFDYNVFFRAWSYNQTINQYSDGVNISFGGLQIYCYDEMNATSLLNFTITVYMGSLSGEDVYAVTTDENPVIITSADVPSGLVVISVSATGYKPRIFYKTFNPPVWETMYVYLPPENNASLYYIMVQSRYDTAIPDAYVTVQKIINDTYQNISVLKTRGDGSVDVYLIPEEPYRIKIEKSGYETRVESLIPSTNQYVYIFKIYTNGSVSVLIGEELGKDILINFSSSNGKIYIYYNDRNLRTNWANFSVYRYNSSGFILVTSFNTTENLFSTNFSADQGTYRLVATLNREWYYKNLTGNGFYRTSTVVYSSFVVYVSVERGNWINNLLITLFGENPLGWIPMIVFILILFILFSFSPAYAPVSLLAVGFVILFIHFVIGFSVVGVGAASFMILSGILLAYKDGKMRRWLP